MRHEYGLRHHDRVRITCPHCDAAYDVPDSLLAGRRAIRCARCGEHWADPTTAVEVAEPAAVKPLAGTDAVEVPFVASAGPPSAPASAGVRFGWAGSALLLALGAWSVIAWRQDVMHAWPPSGRLYAALGLTAGR